MKPTFYTLIALGAATLTLAAVPNRAQAQSIRYEVKVPGYSSAGWIEVRDSRNVGGKVVRDPSGTWTDRVARGENLRVSITDRKPGRCEVKDAIVGVVSDNGFVRGLVADLPFHRDFVVSRDPSFDNVTVIVINRENGNLVTRRVPIGTR